MKTEQPMRLSVSMGSMSISLPPPPSSLFPQRNELHTSNLYDPTVLLYIYSLLEKLHPTLRIIKNTPVPTNPPYPITPCTATAAAKRMRDPYFLPTTNYQRPHVRSSRVRRWDGRLPQRECWGSVLMKRG